MCQAESHKQAAANLHFDELQNGINGWENLEPAGGGLAVEFLRALKGTREQGDRDRLCRCPQIAKHIVTRAAGLGRHCPGSRRLLFLQDNSCLVIPSDDCRHRLRA